ncbi:MAG: biotin carboxylase, partial [Saprospiraceae bacterium]|nr:biotin carboxylase [Saprospiraceae bacterium]
NYVGAGTVEFLVDDKRNFYFLEMNTRLQVEHPVTEMITGLDLVEMQIRVARGEKLPLTQQDLKINGHAIELRVYAEDPLNNFLPSVGNLERYRIPVGAGIRVDDGYAEGLDVPIYYDPMLAKLVVHAPNRTEAIQRMKEAIDMYDIAGVSTTLPFGRFVMNHEAFVSGHFDTNFVKYFYTPEHLLKNDEQEARVAAMLALHLHLKAKKRLKVPPITVSKWSTSRR